MRNIYKDISGKLDGSVVEAIEAVSMIAGELAIPFFLIGASARDIVFSAMFGIPTRRATLDVDVAIKSPTWEKVQVLTERMRGSESFRQSPRMPHRFRYKESVILDIVPFGELENPAGSVQWPSSDGVVMSTMGFEEAFEHSVIAVIKKNPDLKINVCTAPGLAILKLIAWHENSGRTGDAKDILFLMEHYVEAGNDSRLHNEDRDIVQRRDFDYGLASPRLLGRDMAKIASAETHVYLTNILSKEGTGVSSETRLVVDMLRGEFGIDEKLERTMEMLKQLSLGFQERA